MQPKAKKIFIISAIIITILSLLGIIDTISKIGKVQVLIEVSPSNALVTVDGNNLGVGKFYVNPGEHVFAASKQGFSIESKKVRIEKDNNDSIILILVAQSESAKSYMRNSKYEQSLLGRLAGERADNNGNNLKEKSPITSLLPYIASEYRIDYGNSLKHPNDEFAVRIIISAINPENQQKALSLLKSRNYNPDDLEIEYRTLSKPNY